MKKFIIILLCTVSSNLLWATNYYVDNSATGSNNGTSWANAWTSFSNINWNSIQPGDVIYISGGSSSKTYFEQLNIGTAGTSGNSVLIAKGIDSGHNGEVIIDGQNSRAHGINYGPNNDYVTVRGFTIRNTNDSAIDMEGGFGGSYGNYTHTNPIVGSRLEYNKLHITNANGVLAKGTTRCTFYRNVITTSANTSNQTDGYFSQASSFNVWDGDSIIISNANASPHCDGIQINQDTSNIVRNCYIEQDNNKGSNAQGIYTTESFGTIVYYNNVVNLTQSTSNAITHRNLSIGNGNVQIYGNVVFAELGADHAIWCSEQNTPPIIKNNIVRSLNGVFGTIVVTGSNTSQVSHNAITGGSSVGSNVINSNPLFTNESEGVFTLQSVSPAIDVGTNLSAPYNVDKNGTQRPLGGGWDIGAYEHSTGSGGNNPPNQPSNPEPENGATGQPISLTVSWYCTDPDGDPLTFDVYFGTSTNPPLISANQSAWTYNPGILNTNSTYYWKIVAKDNNGNSTTGSIWNFATVLQDITPPEVVSADILDSVTVKVFFSEALEQSGAQNASNYSINNGINVLTAVLSGFEVTLTTSDHSEGTYTVTVNNVTDIAGNVISPTNNSADYEYTGSGGGELEKLVIVDAEADDWFQNYVPPNSIDGITYISDPESRWGGAIPMPDQITFDLGDLKAVGQTRFSFIRWLEGRIYEYAVYSSTDGNNWNLIANNVSSSSSEWSILDFGLVDCQFIRLVSLTNNETQWAGLYEAEIWGLDTPSSGGDPISTMPSEYKLSQNYPNPFNPLTTIQFSLPENQFVTISVYNIIGEQIAELTSREYQAGTHSVSFEAGDIPTGMYLYRIETPSFIETKKMVLLK